LGLVLLLIVNPAESLNTLFSAGDKAVTLCVSLLAIYAFWLGILQIIEDSGLNKIICKLLNPLISFLFGKINDNAREQIAINLSANLLGMGNAATPSGIKGMEFLDDKNGHINEAMTMFMVLNCLSLQIMPTTIIGLRILGGSTEPASIILPTILTSIVSMLFSILAVKIYYKLKIKKVRTKDE
jgi:spore maturation protein A